MRFAGFYIWILITVCATYTCAQTVLSKKKADAYFANEIYQMALPAYLHYLDKDPYNEELNFKTGVCLVHLRKIDEAINYLEKALSRKYAPAYFYRGLARHYQAKPAEAINDYVKFKHYASREDHMLYDADRHIAIALRAQHMMQNPVDAIIKNLGPGINSPYSDYVPVVSADESTLIFTSRRPNALKSTADTDGSYYEDIYISGNHGNGWEKAHGIGSNINTDKHEASVGLSADGQKLILYRMGEKYYGGDLYISMLTGKEWGKPEKISGDINSAFWEPSACLSADEKMIIFSSNRPGGYGGRDLYSAKKLPDGTWSKASNLGPVINTPFDEDAPFLHPDGRTMFFSSTGHTTMGGFDIFRTYLQTDSIWKLPENMGYPINTVDDDIYFVLSTDGQRGYYSSDRSGGLGEKDIYVIHLSDDKLPVTVIKGQVLNNVTGLPVKVAITVIDLDSREIQGVYTSNTETGKYLIVLPHGKHFKAVIEADNYYSASDYLDLRGYADYAEISKDIELKPVK